MTIIWCHGFGSAPLSTNCQIVTTRSEVATITSSSSLAAINHPRESTILFGLSRLAVGSRNSRSGDCWRGASDVNEEQIEWPRHAVEIQRVDEEGRVAGLPAPAATHEAPEL